MPERVDEYSDTKNAPDYVEKKKCRMVRELNAAFPLDHVGKQYDGNPEATKREQSESLHMAMRQVGERHGSPSRRDDLFTVKTHRSPTLVHPIVRPLCRIVMLWIVIKQF